MADASQSQHVDTGLGAVTNCKADIYGPTVGCVVPDYIHHWQHIRPVTQHTSCCLDASALLCRGSLQGSLNPDFCVVWPKHLQMFCMHPCVFMLQGIQHLGNAMGCFMRMKGITFHSIETAPAVQSPSIVTGRQDVPQASVLPAVIQSEAVSISPVVLCPAAISTKSDTDNPSKRQKLEGSGANAVSYSSQTHIRKSNYHACVSPCAYAQILQVYKTPSALHKHVPFCISRRAIVSDCWPLPRLLLSCCLRAVLLPPSDLSCG